jgi:segregation and condensation protein A
MALRNEIASIARKAPARKIQKGDEAVTALGVVSPIPIQVESPRFNGSLAMLFGCVREHKVDVLDVPLLPICEAYFQYLLGASLRDLDQAAAALVALAYLLERKAWALLPVAEPEPEADDAAALMPPSTHEYELAIQALSLWEEEREKFFFRPPDCGPEPYELPFEIGNVTILDLARAFEKLLTKASPEPVAPLNKPRRSLSEQMKVVMRRLSTEWKPLEALITLPFSTEEAVYWFLALLELIRLGQATVKLQEDEVHFSRAA